ncbi:hypothetical protein [Natrialba sp. INN-245]|nr:hypothetical protein [Natrialba sp. INN-245]
MSKKSLENRIENLESSEERTLEDFPEILMQNLREEYGYGR